MQKFSKTTIKKGIGLEAPTEGSKCRVKLKIFLQNERVIEEDGKEIIIGEGDSELSEILDGCLESMHMKELSHIKLSLSDKPICESLQVDSSNILACELELQEFSQAKQLWECSIAEKLCRAQHHKLKGTECFKSEKWVAAARRYSRALKTLIMMRHKMSDEEQDEHVADELKYACYLNLAACQGKLGHHQHVVENCSKVLATNEENIKALYRRGIAYIALNEMEKAGEDLRKALEIEPGNRAVQKQLSVLRQKEREQNTIYAKALRSMFTS